MDSSSDNDEGESRQEQRERKLRKKRERVPKHGRNLGSLYRDAILNRLKRRRPGK